MLSDDSPDFFFLWSGDEFSHLFRMAVRSVRMHNPSADIRVYVTGRWPDSPNFEGMTSDGCASVIRIDADDVIDLLPAHLRGVADLYRKLPTHAHSARSNILRYALLYLHGGVYLDTDVLMLGVFPERGEADALIGTERVWKGDGDRVAGDASVWLRPSTWGWAVSWALTRADSLFFAGALGLAHRLARISDAWMTSQANNAVISARRESRFMERLLLSAAHADPSVRYSTGPTLIDTELRSAGPDVVALGCDSFYSVPPGESYRLFEDVGLSLPPDAVAIHVAASNHPVRLSRMSPSDTQARRGFVVNRVVERAWGAVKGVEGAATR